MTENFDENITHETTLRDHKKFNVDMALKEVGGFGIFQALVTIVCALIRNSGMYFYYGFVYLTLEQKY